MLLIIEALRIYLNITVSEQQVLEAKSGRFPTEENMLHTLDDIDTTRKLLQSKGLLMSIKNSDGVVCDIIPEDIAKQIRKYYNIEIRSYGYDKLVNYVIKKTKKQYLIDIIYKASQVRQKSTIDIPNNPNIQECVDYSLNNDTQILLITADELKQVAETWTQKHSGEIFNLGYFKQNGRFDISLIKF